MTPQDVREKTFEKAVFGGYDMGGVDDFLEEAAASLEAAQKENVVLKSKMKVLVDKIEEYRGSEDAMRQTLLSAQKLAAQIEEEARAKAARTVAEADATAAAALQAIREELNTETVKLNNAKEYTARFLTEARELCTKQLSYLDRVSAPAPKKEEPSIDDAVRSIENSVARIPDEPAPRIDISPAMEQAPRPQTPQDDVTRLFDMDGLN